MYFFPSLQLLLFVLILPSAYSQNATTCKPIQSNDTICGKFSPAPSVFYPEQAAQLAASYLPLLGLICPEVKNVPDFPAIFCLGAIGPCVGANFSLPRTDAQGFPIDNAEVAAFYNTAKFSQILNGMKAVGAKVPCFELCDRIVKVISSCPTIQSLGVNASLNNCDGLPLASTGTCINTISNATDPSKTPAGKPNAAGLVAGIPWILVMFGLAELSLPLPKYSFKLLMNNFRPISDLDSLNFGSELADIKTLDAYVASTISFTYEIRDFLKERADLEKQYARQLDTLAKKYTRKDSAAKRTSIFVSTKDLTTTASESADGSSIQTTWTTLLGQLESDAQERVLLGEHLSSVVCDSVKQFATRNEESRKRQLIFVQRLLFERERHAQESAKCQAEYTNTCDIVEISRQKYERAMDDKAKEKANKTLHQDILDMNNRKNLYILSLEIANKTKAKYHQTDIPKYLLDMHEFSESIVNGITGIWRDYFKLEHQLHQSSMDKFDIATKILELVNGFKDVDLFLARNGITIEGAEIDQPSDLIFEPSGLWKESVPSDEFSRIFLRNVLKKNSEQASHVDAEMHQKFKELDSARKLQGLYQSGLGKDDGSFVDESIRDLLNEITLLNYSKLKHDSQISHLKSNLPDATISHETDRPHSFKSTSFAIPTTCDFCLQTIWGVAKPGLYCKECGFSAHLKCEMKIHPACTGGRGIIKSRRPQTSYPSLEKDVAAVLPERAVILYDYTADDSNVDDCHPELSVREGDVVFVIEIDDGNGWSLVSLKEKMGLIPKSYMRSSSDSCTTSLSPRKQSQPSIEIKQKSLRHKRSVVVFDYVKSTEEEVTVKAGEVVDVIERDDGSGWIKVTNGTVEGLMPASYLEN